MKYSEKCLAKNGNFDFFVMILQTFCGTFRQRERVTVETSCGAERVNDVSFMQNIVNGVSVMHISNLNRIAQNCEISHNP